MSLEQAVLNDQLLIGAVVFCLGVVGFLSRRNLVHVILCGQVTLQGIWITLTALSAFYHDENIFFWNTLFLGVAVVQVIVGISLIVLLSRHAASLESPFWRRLCGAVANSTESREET